MFPPNPSSKILFALRRSRHFMASAALVSALVYAMPVAQQPSNASPFAAGSLGQNRGNTAGCDIVGTKGNDNLKGNKHSQVICGLSGKDKIDGEGGNDIIKGGPGNDTLAGSAGNDTFYGGTGSDTCRQALGHGALHSCEWPDALLRCPVPTGTVYSNFGDPRPGGRTHEGNDILAKKGAKIYAPFSGKLVKGRSSLGGKEEFVYGDRGYVFNAHLSKQTNNRRVHTGDVIGYVGSTGDAGTTNHDHFEWHPENRSAIDPFPYLKKVCQSTHRAPARSAARMSG